VVQARGGAPQRGCRVEDWVWCVVVFFFFSFGLFLSLFAVFLFFYHHPPRLVFLLLFYLLSLWMAGRRTPGRARLPCSCTGDATPSSPHARRLLPYRQIPPLLRHPNHHASTQRPSQPSPLRIDTSHPRLLGRSLPPFLRFIFLPHFAHSGTHTHAHKLTNNKTDFIYPHLQRCLVVVVAVLHHFSFETSPSPEIAASRSH